MVTGPFLFSFLLFITITFAHSFACRLVHVSAGRRLPHRPQPRPKQLPSPPQLSSLSSFATLFSQAWASTHIHLELQLPFQITRLPISILVKITLLSLPHPLPLFHFRFHFHFHFHFHSHPVTLFPILPHVTRSTVPYPPFRIPPYAQQLQVSTASITVPAAIDSSTPTTTQPEGIISNIFDVAAYLILIFFIKFLLLYYQDHSTIIQSTAYQPRHRYFVIACAAADAAFSGNAQRHDSQTQASHPAPAGAGPQQHSHSPKAR